MTKDSGKEFRREGVSRRTFLEGASLAALAAVGIASTGCAPKGAAATGSAANSGATANATVDTTHTWSAEIDNPVWALEEIGEPTETIKADVCILGAGATGLAAGLQANQLGLKAVLLEKKAAAGGSFIGCEGLFAVNSHLQTELGYNYTVNEFIEDCLVYHHFVPEIDLMRAYFSKSGETIKWLEDLGVEFDFVQAQAGSRVAWHIPKGSPKPGAYCTQQMIAAAQNAGLQIELETPAKQILVDDDGKVEGVLALKKDGTVVKVEARAVIIGTGGYASNDDFVNYISGAIPGSYLHLGMDGRDADGIKMGHDVGAELCSAPGTMNLCGPTPVDVPFSTLAFGVATQPNSLWVNQDGDRYVRESIITTNFSNAGLAAKPVEKTFIIFSQNCFDDLESGHGAYTGNGVFYFPNKPMEGLTQAIAELSDTSMKKGNTIAELATACGLDAKKLQATVDRYNELCAKGEDEDMLKPAEYMKPLETGPYYAFNCLNSLFFTVGGLHVSPKTEVLGSDLQPIPGLYAGGCDAGGLYGDCYDYIITPGSQGAWCVNSGRIAAESAAEYLK